MERPATLRRDSRAASPPPAASGVEDSTNDFATEPITASSYSSPPPMSAPTVALPRDKRVLVRMDGPYSGEPIVLPESDVIIGRSTDAHVHLQELDVSKHHARIFPMHGTLFIEDLDSRNGTYVLEQKIKEAQLYDGDLVRLGSRSTFRFSLMDASQERILSQLFESSVYDALTEVFNRRHFEHRLAAEFAFAMRHNTELGLALIDIDRFKAINDKFGHVVGDAVLRQVAQVARGQLRSEDLLARYGGEEFVILFRAIPLSGVARAAERLRSTVAERTIQLDEIRVAVSVSVGCATLACLKTPTPQGLVQAADVRLYKAKRRGRNCVICG